MLTSPQLPLRALLSLLLTAAVVVACVRSVPLEPTVPAQLESVFTLRPGEAAAIEGTGLRMRFVAVVEDSRCPEDVECVWAGDALVRLLLSDRGAPERTIDLHTHLEPRSHRVGDYSVMLERLGPVPRTEAAIPPHEYAADFRVAPVP